MQERIGNTENQISEVDQRVITLEQDSGSRVGGMPGTVGATLTLVFLLVTTYAAGASLPTL